MAGKTGIIGINVRFGKDHHIRQAGVHEEISCAPGSSDIDIINVCLYLRLNFVFYYVLRIMNNLSANFLWSLHYDSQLLWLLQK